MRYSEINGTKISSLGFGMMRLPLDTQGEIDFQQGFEMVDFAIKNGINYFDTAYMYHHGKSEPFVKKALSERYDRTEFLLTSKLPTWLCHSKAEAEEKLKEQLERCGVDYFDFYLLHSVDEETWDNIEKNNMGEVMAEAKKKGLVKHIGASFHCGPVLLRKVLETYGDILEFIQLQINYLDWDFINAKELYQIAEEFNKPVIIMEPLRGGMLSKVPGANARKVLNKLIEAKNLSYTDLALGWVDSLPQVVITLSGMSNLEQMKENITFFSKPEGLSKEDVNIINEAAASLSNELFIPCTKCNYCQDCPKGIHIPEVFEQYNEAAAKDFHYIWGSLSQNYKKLTPSAKECIACGLCEKSCPQHLKIINLLKEVENKFDYLETIGE